jgi:hypothetical protein
MYSRFFLLISGCAARFCGGEFFVFFFTGQEIEISFLTDSLA